MDDLLGALDPGRLDVPLDRAAEQLADLVAEADQLPATERSAAMGVLAAVHRRLRDRLEEVAEVLAAPEEFDQAVIDALREHAVQAEDIDDYLAEVAGTG